MVYDSETATLLFVFASCGVSVKSRGMGVILFSLCQWTKRFDVIRGVRSGVGVCCYLVNVAPQQIARAYVALGEAVSHSETMKTRDSSSVPANIERATTNYLFSSTG